MKRLIVPAFALGVAIALVAPAQAGLLDCLHRDKCASPCKPSCKPACPKPCQPECPKPCDPCNGGHKFGGKLRGLFHGHHKRSCEPCGDPCNGWNGNGTVAPAEPGHEGHAPSTYNTTPAPRLTPVPANTTMRTRTRSYGF